MCVVSAIGDDFSQRWPPHRWPKPPIYPDVVPYPAPIDSDPFVFNPKKPDVSREDFDQLKREMEALKEALKAAKKYDEVTGQPDCELDEKIAVLRKLAKLVGVDLSDVFQDKKPN